MDLYDFSLIQLPPDKKVVFARTTQGGLYRSNDFGRSFMRLNELHFENNKVTGIGQVSTDPRKLYFFTAEGNFYTTADAGATFTKTAAPAGINLVWCHSHPSQSDWLVCMGWKGAWGGEQQAFYTKDYGKTWTYVATFVWMVLWPYDPNETDPGKKWSEDSILMSYIPPGRQTGSMWSLYEYQVVYTNDYMKTVHVVLDHTPFLWFGSGEGKFYSAQLQQQNSMASNLWVSVDSGHSFFKVNFPDKLAEGGWSLLDDSEGALFMSDDQTSQSQVHWGDVYVSDQYNNDFTLSLRYLVRNGWIGDWARFEGLEGIYVANVFDQVESSPTASSPVKTVITYDMGGRWKRLPAPTGSSCSSDECYLNLHGPTDTIMGRFYSWYDAIGLMLGTGNVGSYLEADTGDTYFTRDAGASWVKLMDGPTVYEFGDHGGLIALADGDDLSNVLTYTWNEGAPFTQCQMTEEPFEILNIIVSNASSLDFWAYGVRNTPDKGDLGVIVWVDFSDFHQRPCNDTDYEWWYPDDGEGGNCLMGRKVAYRRRAQHAQCYNGEISDIPKFESQCPCSEQDFECDFCYELNEAENQCVWVCQEGDANGYRPGQPPPDCVDVWYPNAKGWRLVDGTACSLTMPGADQRLGQPEKCPNSASGSSRPSALVMLILAIVIVVVILVTVGFILYNQNEGFKAWLNEKWQNLSSSQSPFRISESTLQKDTTALTLEEEETA